jgi:death-on-curing protein
MKKLLWIEREDALAIHDMVLGQHGGLAGIRDMGLLDSALNRPRHLHTYEKPDLPALSAAYAHGIVQNHPFHDGNKRTGFLVAATFLETNGWGFAGPEDEVVLSTVALADRKMSESEYGAWLRRNSKQLN